MHLKTFFIKRKIRIWECTCACTCCWLCSFSVRLTSRDCLASRNAVRYLRSAMKYDITPTSMAAKYSIRFATNCEKQHTRFCLIIHTSNTARDVFYMENRCQNDVFELWLRLYHDVNVKSSYQILAYVCMTWNTWDCSHNSLMSYIAVLETILRHHSTVCKGLVK